MSDKSIFTNLKEYQAHLEGLAMGNDDDINAIHALFKKANDAKAEWPEDFSKLFQSRLSKFFDGRDKKKIEAQHVRLLREALTAKMDTPVLREKYMFMAKKEFPAFKNEEELGAALKLNDSSTSLDDVICRWQMLHAIKMGAICFDKEYSRCQVIALDEAKLEVQLQTEHRKNIPLTDFMDEYIIIADLSNMHTILEGGSLPICRDGKNIRAFLENDLICGHALPEEALKSILVPHVMTESHYNTQILGIREKSATSDSNEADKETKQAEVRWDESRNVLELSERLKQVTTLNVEGEFQKENVVRILNNGKERLEYAEKFALSLALILKNTSPDMREWIFSLAEELSTAVVWKELPLCIEVSNKVPGKIVQFWFEYTAKAKGFDFLSKLIIKLPYRLWSPIEHLLKANNQLALLNQEVEAALTTGRVSCDLLYWLWRSGNAELKAKYIGDATLVFKTLHAEVKGDYLKAQRDLRHLLLDDMDFQIMIMRNGEDQAVVDLIRCVKRYPLLDPGEIQSILVKISEIYPEHISDIEEKHTGPTRIAISKVTSIRGYNKRVAELKELVDVLQPENVKAIEHARSLGDLRENSEFKYAKEQQRLLGIRRREWENSLVGLRATDFSDIQLDNVVVPGCAVTIKYKDGSSEVFYILGLLDSEPDKHIISYDAPLGKLLVGSSAGTRLTMPNGSKATLESIDKLPADIAKYISGK